MKPENIILELKKQSFALANEGSDNEEEGEEGEKKKEGEAKGEKAAPEPAKVEEINDSLPGTDEDDDSDEEGGGGNY